MAPKQKPTIGDIVHQECGKLAQWHLERSASYLTGTYDYDRSNRFDEALKHTFIAKQLADFHFVQSIAYAVSERYKKENLND